METILGAVIGAILRHFFPKALDYLFTPDLSGWWTFDVHTRRTSYEPYEGMLLTYIVMLDADGTKVFGSGEKDSERSAIFEGTHVSKDRSPITVQGTVKPRVLRPPVVRVVINEVGKLRESVSRHELVLDRKARAMRGTFTSTVARQEGRVVWHRRHNV